MRSLLRIVGIFLAAGLVCMGSANAEVKPGDVITKENAAKVVDLVSPGNYILVQQGMQMKIVPTDQLGWPPPFKSATEKYSPQVQLAPDATLVPSTPRHPFPFLYPTHPQ